MFDRGIEALLKSAASMDSRKQDGNKSMTLDDLLIKVQCFNRMLCARHAN